MTHSNVQNPWLVIVLAAGRGTRMGGPKALMTVGGEPWWRVQARRLDHAGVDALWVVSPEVAASMDQDADAPADCVMGDARLSMFHSILAGLRWAAAKPAPPTAVFVLPVDVPAPVDTRVYARLVERRRVAVPTHRGVRGHPVCLPWAWVAGALIGPIAQAADPGSLRLDTLIAGESVQVPVDDPLVAMNLNTPEDVLALERTLGRAA